MRAATAGVLILVATMVLSSATVRAQQTAPTNLQASSSGNNVVITWRAASNIPPDGFRLEAGTGPGLADLAIVNIPWSAQQGLDAQFAAAGVAPGVYYLRVREVHGRTAGEPSAEVTMRVGFTGCALPYAPRNVTTSVVGDVVTLKWEPSASGGVPAGYVIEAGSVPGAPNVAIITLNTTMMSVAALPGRYFVRLRAMGTCGASEPSSEVVVVVP